MLNQDELNIQYAEEVLLPMDEARAKAEAEEEERIKALEQLVKDYQKYAKAYGNLYYPGRAWKWVEWGQRLDACANALLSPLQGSDENG